MKDNTTHTPRAMMGLMAFALIAAVALAPAAVARLDFVPNIYVQGDTPTPDRTSVMSQHYCWGEHEDLPQNLWTHCAFAYASSAAPGCGGEYEPRCDSASYCGEDPTPADTLGCSYIVLGGGGEGMLLPGAATVSGAAAGACVFQANERCVAAHTEAYLWVPRGACYLVTTVAESVAGTTAHAVAGMSAGGC